MLYPLLRPLLFTLPAETAHHAALCALRRNAWPAQTIRMDPMLSQALWGMEFSHPVGLPAGFDKNAEVLGALFGQGFSFVETGTVTPLPQAGNVKPRMFRLTEDEAVVNRLGFNNLGMATYLERLETYYPHKKGIVGANIGKNKDSADAAADYLTLLEAVYAYADYVVVNISSPNTPGLRDLQHREALAALLAPLTALHAVLAERHQRYVPLLVKLAPDMEGVALEAAAEEIVARKLDGIVLTNTTLARPETLRHAARTESGGLSGKPLMERSTEVLREMYRLTGGAIPLVGVGGIASAADAYTKIRAGASVVQLYSALVYQGFGLVKQIVEELPLLLRRDGFSSLKEAVGADHR